MPPRQGTGFVNWDQFVNANRGTAERLAGDLQGGVAETGANAKKNLSLGEQAIAEQIGVNDSSGATDYSGSSSLADTGYFQEGQMQADKAARDSRQLANNWGRMGMLAEKFAATPGYGVGMQAFDASLLGSVGQGGFEAQRKEFSGLPGQFSSALAGSVKDVEAARNRASGRRNQPTDPTPQQGDVFNDFIQRPPMQREPDLAVDAPWTGKRPKKLNEYP